MTLERALLKLERNGWNHDVRRRRCICTKDRMQESIELILDASKEVVAVRVLNPNDKDRPEEDYYAGTWCSNLSKAILLVQGLIVQARNK